ncbi:MAG: hypothetical protein H7Y22_09265, partial [Gemmatimonadaceae bacterium]|nr:hypothetical protein [Gloeobacterales cyanobacterium ES-bin-141]
LAFQISNEANIFPYKTYYTDPSTGKAVPIRPSDWTFDEYISEFNAHKNALYNRVSTSLPLNGPVFSGGSKDDGRWKNYFPDFMKAEASAINSVSYHGYPYTACPDDPDDIPTISDVLSNKASHDFVQGFVPIVAEAGEYGKKMRISETNSMTCGGVNGVSNTLAAALWATDMMFEAANIGAGGVNIITGSQPDMTPLYFDGHIDYEGVATYTPQVYPLYYGMLLFAQAAANQGSLVPVSITKTGNMKVWATKDNTGAIRVVALNKDQSLSGNARITIAGTSGSASLTRLSASSVSAKTGLTLAGQTFDGTTDGKPKGSYTSTSVSSSNGTYVFSLPKGSAAMLTVGGSGGGGDDDDDAVEVSVDLDKSTYTKGQKMYVEATSSDSPSQVKFYIDNQQVWAESNGPYWLGGNSGSDVKGYSTSGLAVGSHTLKAVSVVGGVSYSSPTAQFQINQ